MSEGRQFGLKYWARYHDGYLSSHTLVGFNTKRSGAAFSVENINTKIGHKNNVVIQFNSVRFVREFEKQHFPFVLTGL